MWRQAHTSWTTSASRQHGGNLLWPITCVGRRYAYTKESIYIKYILNTSIKSLLFLICSSVFIISTSASNLSMRTIKFCYVVFGVTSRLLVINKIHWCVALRRPSSAINKRRHLMLPETSVTKLPRTGGTLFTTRDEARYWSKIAIFTWSTCIRRPL